MKTLKILGMAIVSTLMLVYGALVVVSAFNPSMGADSKSTEESSMPAVYVDQELQPIATRLGIDTTGLTIRYVTSLENKESGNFDGEHTISLIRGGNDTQSMDVILAHEYLHYKWNAYTQAEKDALSVEFEALYDTDSQMKARMQPYVDNEHLTVGSQEFSNELHSVYCTESSDAYLSPPVLQECNKWINRSALSFAR